MFNQYYYEHSEKTRKAINYLENCGIVYRLLFELSDYLDQERSINPDFDEIEARVRIEKLKDNLLKKYSKTPYFQEIKENLEILSNFIFGSVYKCDSDFNLNPEEMKMYEPLIKEYTLGEKNIENNFKNLLKEVLEELGLKEMINIEAFLLNLIIYLENVLSDYHSYFISQTNFNQIQIIKEKLKEQLRRILEIELKDGSETVKINFINEELLESNKDLIPYIKEYLYYYKSIGYKGLTFTFYSKTKSLSVTTNEAMIEYSPRTYKICIVSDIRTTIYNQMSTMQADYGFKTENQIDFNKLTTLQFNNPSTQYRLIIAPNGLACYTLTKDGEEIISLNDIEVTYDEIIINTLNFQQYINIDNPEYTDYRGNNNYLTAPVKKILNKLKIRYLYSCDDLRFSCISKDFSIEEMWKYIRKEEEKAKRKYIRKKYERRN